MDKFELKRIHIFLPPEALMDLDDYRFSARIVSRSETMRYLAGLALRGTLPPAHLHALQAMRTEQSQRSVQDMADLLDKYQNEKQRIHISLGSNDLKAIDAYKRAERIGTRAETIRTLISLSLVNEFSRGHLLTLNRIADRQTQDRAYQIWEQEGHPDGKHTEHWFRAKAEILAMNEASFRSSANGLLPRLSSRHWTLAK